MAYRLVIADIVEVPIDFTLKSEREPVSFSFSLTCDRLQADEIRGRTAGKGKTLNDFLASVIKGWSGQKLVVDEAGVPASFNPESLAVMLNTSGVALVIYSAYLMACSAKGKN
jgi:hypothetical protein